MGDETGIGWTDHTFNPWVGCARVSPACTNCYAEAWDDRYAGGEHWGKNAERRVTADANWRKPLKWDRDAQAAGRPALVFCASLADVFEDRDDLDPTRQRLWQLIEQTPNLVWQLLTKRPEQIRDRVPVRWLADGHWPANVWVGTTVEDQERAELRIPLLLEVPAPVRFLSCEPLLGPVDLSAWLGNIEWMDALRVAEHPESFRGDGGWGREMFAALAGAEPPLGWVIVGGESGPGFRPLVEEQAWDVVDQCWAAGVPVFFKQVGGATPKAGGDLLRGQLYQAWPEQAGDRGTPVALP